MINSSNNKDLEASSFALLTNSSLTSAGYSSLNDKIQEGSNPTKGVLSVTISAKETTL